MHSGSSRRLRISQCPTATRTQTTTSSEFLYDVDCRVTSSQCSHFRSSLHLGEKTQHILNAQAVYRPCPFQIPMLCDLNASIVRKIEYISDNYIAKVLFSEVSQYGTRATLYLIPQLYKAQAEDVYFLFRAQSEPTSTSAGQRFYHQALLQEHIA